MLFNGFMESSCFIGHSAGRCDDDAIGLGEGCDCEGTYLFDAFDACMGHSGGG